MVRTSQLDNTVVVRFSNVARRFGKFTAISNLNLDIHHGEIVGLLGPNGAGKSTTMKMMRHISSGLVKERFLSVLRIN